MRDVATRDGKSVKDRSSFQKSADIESTRKTFASYLEFASQPSGWQWRDSLPHAQPLGEHECRVTPLTGPAQATGKRMRFLF
ncbi:MAG: hypothetical protein A3F41_06050 [Coxiella sp. RIFCSPHIGHO2_12_FULL_44_14]|nr:MAG: hypothetical protein A3F41_06050 [Coxiella sp. RIFCSPHIGHO2_12_FULL_44_14]